MTYLIPSAVFHKINFVHLLTMSDSDNSYTSTRTQEIPAQQNSPRKKRILEMHHLIITDSHRTKDHRMHWARGDLKDHVVPNPLP